MKELDFEAGREKIAALLSKRREIFLATCANDRVTARAVYCVSRGTEVYFMTSTAYLKYKQLEKNANVALCFDNVQLEGKATLLGHPNDNAALIAELSPDKEFMAVAHYKNTVLIRIDLTMAEMWVAHGREYVDFCKGTSYRIG